MCLLESDIWGKKKDAVKHRLKNSKTATLLASQHTLHFLNQPNEGAEGGGHNGTTGHGHLPGHLVLE